MRIYRRFRSDRDLVLFRGNCIDLLKQLPSESVDLTITSPPYCMRKEYERTEHVQDFADAHLKILPEIVRVTKKGGSICWQVGYHIKDSIVTPLDFIVHNILQVWPEIILRNRVVWTYGHGLHCASRFSGRHETLLWYTKGEGYRFHLDAVRVPQKYPGKRHYKGERRGEFSGNPLGKNPSDVWDIPNVKANHVEKTSHPCQFPIALALRLIRALTNPGDTILDPFLGSGTTAVAAILEGRKAVGAEIKSKYFKVAIKRCLTAAKHEIRYRDPQRPVLVPNPNTEVARNPFRVNGKEHLYESKEVPRA